MKNTGITLLRICAMLMIVLCHVANYIEVFWVAQFLNVGVFVFLLISGWLYRNKEINNSIIWLIGRWKRLCVPVIIWIFCVIVYSFFVENELPQAYEFVLFLFNLQGGSWFIPGFPYIQQGGVFAGCGNLWFVSIIMICYVLLIIVKKFENKITAPNLVLIWSMCVTGFIVLALLGINIGYFLCFFIGYALGRVKSLVSNKMYGLVTFFMIAAIFARLLVKALIDGTNVYNVIVVTVTHTILAIWIFYTLLRIDAKFACIHKFAASSIAAKIDELSYYIYITHNYFLVTRFGLSDLIHGLPAQLLLFFVLTMFTALFVKWINKLIMRFLLRKIT